MHESEPIYIAVHFKIVTCDCYAFQRLLASKVRSPLTPHGGVCRTVNYRSER